MTPSRSSQLLVTVAAAVVLGVAATASAQETTAPAPLVIERVHEEIIVAPDFKFTTVNDHTSQLAGVYVGQQHDDSLLIGGAAYWLVNGHNDDSLWYGGLLFGWSTPATRPIQFGGRALVGFGGATLGFNDVIAYVPVNDPRRAVRVGGSQWTYFRVRDDFFVFEPQASLTARLAEHVGVNVGASYRLAGFTDLLGDRVNGPSGSVAVQFGW